MKLKRFFSFLLFAAVITAFTACDEDEDTSVPVDVTLNFTAPSDTITSFTWAEGKATISHRPKPMPSICRSPISNGMTKPKKAWTRI